MISAPVFWGFVLYVAIAHVGGGLMLWQLWLRMKRAEDIFSFMGIKLGGREDG